MSVRNIRYVFCFILILTTLACGRMSKAKAVTEMKVEQEQAQEFIQAIDAYKQKQGRFPKGLDVLVPTYLSDIPLTTQGQGFIYERDRLDGYNLCFYLPRKKIGVAAIFTAWNAGIAFMILATECLVI